MTRLKQFVWNMDKTLRDLICGIVLYFFLITLLGLFLVADKSGYVCGTLFGCLTAIGLSVHMYCCLDKGLDMEQHAAQKYIFSRSMLRLFLMLVAAYIGVMIPAFSMIGVILGLLGLKFSGLMQPLVSAYITNKIFKEGE